MRTLACVVNSPIHFATDAMIAQPRLLLSFLSLATVLAPALIPAQDQPTEVPVDRFTLPEDLEVTLWAKTPLLRNPTNIDFDAKGRLYVAEGVNYRGKAGRQPEGDRIMILEDTTGAGKADRSTVFIQEKGLESPLGVAVFGNRVVVSMPPDMLVYTDVNGDGKFDAATDKREVLLTGFNGRQHDHSLHSVTAGPDGLWYWNQGNTGAQFADRNGRKFFMGSAYSLDNIAGQKSDDGHVWVGGFAARMEPDGTSLSIIGHNFRNSYEQTVTSFGDVFQSDNDDPPACRITAMMEGGNAGFASADGHRSWEADRRPGQDTPTAEWRQEDPGTMPSGDVYGGGSPTGVAFYENGALGEKWRGLLLACEAGKNVVFGYFPKPEGAGFKLERFDFLTSNKEKEWAGSDFLGGRANNELKTKFRPSDVCVGPDGAIYVADWFDPGVGGHGTADDGTTGAIYRIAPKGFKSQIPAFDLNTLEGQLSALRSPAVNLRHGAFKRLQAQGAAAVPAVAALMADSNPYLAARAVWLLAKMGEAGQARAKTWLDSPDETQRLVACRALRRAGQDVLALATRMAADPSPAIRREAALSLRDIKSEQCIPVLVKIASQFDGRDRSYLEALGLGSEGREGAVFTALAPSFGQDPLTWSDAAVWIAWRLHPVEAVSAFQTRALSAKLNQDQRRQMLTALAFTPAREAAQVMLAIAADPASPSKDLALWWLLNRKGNDWSSFDLDRALKERGIYDPDKVQLTAIALPQPPANAPAFPPAAEVAALQGDPAKGSVSVALCYTCHHIGQAGVEFGPDLTAFGKQQTTATIVEAIVNPSASISHGYEGTEITTTDGLTITGMVLKHGDPLLLKCMGGTLQTIPKSRIASAKPLGRSLMYDPATLGLTPQTVADIVAYLKKP
jgi:putative membrane-bound dehydrogenase-like protein